MREIALRCYELKQNKLIPDFNGQGITGKQKELLTDRLQFFFCVGDGTRTGTVLPLRDSINSSRIFRLFC